VAPASSSAPAPKPVASSAAVSEVLSPIGGKFFKTKDSSETALKVGDVVKEGQIIGYVEAMKVFNAISSTVSGTIVEIVYNSGDDVDEDDVLFKIQ
ncbi:MAG TPA: acetyl-CoA carboxylase biotin carboxyl carrier protein subunit, partial [Bacteroidales bacterium]|nr:acetyl-CoA carboxylase biotin carboxyl carrier protein subunit [Bacteroidales bacterium]